MEAWEEDLDQEGVDLGEWEVVMEVVGTVEADLVALGVAVALVVVVAAMVEAVLVGWALGTILACSPQTRS